jgi:Na+-transporting NADH:ubiquinone oxidoreductase subunit B
MECGKRMKILGFQVPDKPFLIQRVMMRVCYGLIPVILGAVYFFGWRSLAVIAIVFVFGIATEAVFTFRRNQPVTSAVFVTCLIFSLSLPPTIPFWMAIVGIIIGVTFGKMIFGGFGQNVFNPAMAGRCFLYIAFPMEMTNTWMEPFWHGTGGGTRWSNSADAITQATPLIALKNGEIFPWQQLFVGNIPGSMGETSAFLILIGGIYILVKKAASWRLAGSCVLGGVAISGALSMAGFSTVAPPMLNLLAGSFSFGALFVVTEPISGAKTKGGQWVYGSVIGGLTVILRGFSNFSCGIMFSVLIMNAFVPVLDRVVRQIQAAKRPSQEAAK